MSWAKLDDGLWANPKVISVGNEATGAYCRMLSYCGQQLTDGMVKGEIASFIAKSRVIDKLVDQCFVEPAGDGLLIPDYLDFNPTRETVEEERAKARERMRKLRGNRG